MSMANIDKVISKLTVRIQSDSEEWDTIELPIEQAEEILALLKEQEVVKPKSTVTIGGIIAGLCPTCGTVLNNILNVKACGKCGQAVKWE